MEAKTHTKMVRIKTSTVVQCYGCHRETKIYEELWQDGDRYYHDGCLVTKADKKSVVKVLELKDDLSVKSQGA